VAVSPMPAAHAACYKRNPAACCRARLHLRTMSSLMSCRPPGSAPLLYRSSTEHSSDASPAAVAQGSCAITLPPLSRISGSYSMARTKAETCRAETAHGVAAPKDQLSYQRCLGFAV
jgi:hypothetical protein